ncbi:MAG: peptide deformylase [Chlorobi bacterium]|nr:peptide deformylase [Chlorobiota bacterium]
MILPVHIIGSSVLRKTAKDIDKTYPDLTEFIKNMYETMYASDGVGLAAPQVGKSIRVFVIDAEPMAEDNPELKDFKRTFINAHITRKSKDTIKTTEGCLSIPDIHEDVERHTSVTVEYVNENFEPVTETFNGLAAVILQHEYDHLDGILFTDKVSPLRKKFLKRKLAQIAKGHFDKRYKYMLGEKYR